MHMYCLYCRHISYTLSCHQWHARPGVRYIDFCRQGFQNADQYPGIPVCVDGTILPCPQKACWSKTGRDTNPGRVPMVVHYLVGYCNSIIMALGFVPYLHSWTMFAANAYVTSLGLQLSIAVIECCSSFCAKAHVSVRPKCSRISS